MIKRSSRRNFIKQASLLGAGTIALSTTAHAENTGHIEAVQTDGGENYTFLFQGDSITDGNRTRNTDWNHVMGHGYQYIIASKLWFEQPAKSLHFFNRGVSGNTIADLAKRWQADAIDIKPDLLSILIGINDTARTTSGVAGFTAEAFETGYRDLLTQTKAALPNVQLVIMEPFVQSGTRTQDKWEDYQREIALRQASAKKLATEFDAIFIPLQEAFDKAIGKYAPIEYWIWDGVHPMPAGHELIAREWLKQVGKKLRFIRT